MWPTQSCLRGPWDTLLTYEDMQAAGSGLGAGGFTVYDDSACMVEVASILSRFLYVESCGQCLPCKLGTQHITEALERIRDGSGSESDLDMIEEGLREVSLQLAGHILLVADQSDLSHLVQAC